MVHLNIAANTIVHVSTIEMNLMDSKIESMLNMRSKGIWCVYFKIVAQRADKSYMDSSHYCYQEELNVSRHILSYHTS